MNLQMPVPALVARPDFVEDALQFEALAPQWEALRHRTGAGPFLAHGWLANWWAAFGEGKRLAVCLEWDGPDLAAALPLYVEDGRMSRLIPAPTRLARLLGDSRTGTTGWLALEDSPETLARLWRLADARTGATRHHYEPCRQDEALLTMVAAIEATGGSAVCRTTMSSRFVDITGDWSSFLARRSGSFRKNIRKTASRIEQAGGSFRDFTHAERDFADRMLAVSDRTWKTHQGTAMSSSPALERFLRGTFARPEIREMLCASVLEIGGVPIASYLALLDGGRGYGLLVEFDEAHAALAPGRAVVTRWLQRCHERGLTHADFLRDTSLTSIFSDETYEIGRVVAFPRRSPAWAMWQAEERLAWIAREARRRQRQSKRRASQEAA